MHSAIIILLFLIFELTIFYIFYSNKVGRLTIYKTWYAWIIDVLAMFSGVSIMVLALVSLYNPWIFTLSVPKYLFVTLFIFGSWQFGIHIVKLMIRSATAIIKKRNLKKAGEENLKEFSEEYEIARENYFEDIKDDGERNQSVKSVEK